MFLGVFGLFACKLSMDGLAHLHCLSHGCSVADGLLEMSCRGGIVALRNIVYLATVQWSSSINGKEISLKIMQAAGMTDGNSTICNSTSGSSVLWFLLC